MADAFIVSAVRTPVGKAPNGALRYTPSRRARRRRHRRSAAARAGARRGGDRGRHPRLRDAGGRAGPERRAHRQPARRHPDHARRRSPSTASARPACRRSPTRAERIMLGDAHAIVAGGTESMSMVPMGGNKIAPNPALVDSYPDVYLTTGLVAENHVRDYGISREEQDAFALRSHQRAVAAIDAGRFADETVAGRGPGGGRRAAARHVDRGARQAEAGVSCEGHRDGRKLVADERRRGRGRRHERRAGARAGPDAARTLRRLRHRRRRARAVRHRARCRPSARC